MLKDNITDIIKDIKQGKMVIILDDESRENEGDLVCAADQITSEIINFMASKGKGLICLPMNKSLIKKYNLQMMTNNNKAANRTAFTVSIEAAEGITTGISAADRAHTIKTAMDKDSKASDIVQPGHIFPLKAMEGGVLSRAGHTEAACDLAKLAGFQSAGVICEIMNEDGTMARRDDLIKFGEKYEHRSCQAIEKNKAIFEKFGCRIPILYAGELLDKFIQKDVFNCSYDITLKALDFYLNKRVNCSMTQTCESARFKSGMKTKHYYM